jgi:hypothetical protein
MTNLKHLAIFYTHNRIAKPLLDTTLFFFQRMINNPVLPFQTQAVIVSCDPVDLSLREGKSINSINLIAPEAIRDKGHFSIIEKLSYAMNAFPSDFISLHEHDVLYPEDYLLVVQTAFSEYNDYFDFLAYSSIIGVNKSGYVERSINDTPLSCLTFGSPALKLLLEHKREEVSRNEGWCYLEPGYGGSYGGQMRKLQLGADCTFPIVHVNMNKTNENHHFTNHYDTYKTKSKNGFDQWPGNLSHLFV